MRIWKLPGPVVRVVFMLVLVLVALLFLRRHFIPETFGVLGPYRAAAVTENAELPIRYAALQLCAECHDEESEVKRNSYHRGLTCEGCHGPSADHAIDPTEALPLIPRERSMCLRCHEYRFSRPTGFPQVISELHNPMESCLGCHAWPRRRANRAVRLGSLEFLRGRASFRGASRSARALPAIREGRPRRRRHGHGRDRVRHRLRACERRA